MRVIFSKSDAMVLKGLPRFIPELELKSSRILNLFRYLDYKIRRGVPGRFGHVHR